MGKPLKAHKNWVLSVAFSPDGKRLVSASADYTLLLWDVDTGKTIGDALTGHGKEVFSAAFSPDGRRIVSGMGDGTVRLWSVEAAVPIEQGAPGSSAWRPTPMAAWSPPAAATAPFACGTPSPGSREGEPLTGARRETVSAAWRSAPDGRLLASAGEDGTVQVVGRRITHAGG